MNVFSHLVHFDNSCLFSITDFFSLNPLSYIILDEIDLEFIFLITYTPYKKKLDLLLSSCKYYWLIVPIFIELESPNFLRSEKQERNGNCYQNTCVCHFTIVLTSGIRQCAFCLWLTNVRYEIVIFFYICVWMNGNCFLRSYKKYIFGAWEHMKYIVQEVSYSGFSAD